MPDIHILREHDLGLVKARKVALQWATEAETNFDMTCTVVEGETSDIVAFTRSGVKGELLVEAQRFTLDAKLGFLLGAFSQKIETEIEKNLDALLAGGGQVTRQAAGNPGKPVKSSDSSKPSNSSKP